MTTKSKTLLTFSFPSDSILSLSCFIDGLIKRIVFISWVSSLPSSSPSQPTPISALNQDTCPMPPNLMFLSCVPYLTEWHQHLTQWCIYDTSLFYIFNPFPNADYFTSECIIKTAASLYLHGYHHLLPGVWQEILKWSALTHPPPSHPLSPPWPVHGSFVMSFLSLLNHLVNSYHPY